RRRPDHHIFHHQRSRRRSRHQGQQFRHRGGEGVRRHDRSGLIVRAALLIALALLGSSAAWAAEEPSGCDKFKWPIDRERAALTAPDRPRLVSGAEVAAAAPAAMTLALRPPGDATLPSPPER